MAYFLKFQPQGAFEHGIFVPYRTQEEAERQIANDLMNSVRDDFDGIVKASLFSKSTAYVVLSPHRLY